MIEKNDPFFQKAIDFVKKEKVRMGDNLERFILIWEFHDGNQYALNIVSKPKIKIGATGERLISAERGQELRLSVYPRNEQGRAQIRADGNALYFGMKKKFPIKRYLGGFRMAHEFWNKPMV